MNQLPKLSNESKTYKRNHKINLLIAFTFGCVFSSFFYFASYFPVEESLYIGITGAAFSILFLYHADYERHVVSSYLNRLKDYDLDQLIQLSNSKELDDTERGLVVKFLNENHSGWSISKSVHV